MQGAHPLGRVVLATAVATAALTAVFGATAHPAAACSCAMPSDWEVAARADAVVVGTRLDDGRSAVDSQMVIDVERVLKGEAADRQGVLGAGFMCGPEVEPARRSLLFLERDEAGRLRLMACSPSRPVDESAETVAFVLGDRPTSPGSVAYAVGAPVGRRPLVVLVGGLLVVVAVLALVGRRLDRRAGRAAFSPPGGRPPP